MKSAIYTKRGDNGETTLANGTRVSKSDARIEVYGNIDELNSFLGLANEYVNDNTSTLKPVILSIQKDLFRISSEIAIGDDRAAHKLPRISEDDITYIENLIDKFDEGLHNLQFFIIPGGSKLSSMLHICRTIARRVERKVARFNQVQAKQQQDSNKNLAIPSNILVYFNRLSDLLFVLARYALKREGCREIIAG